MDARLRQLLRAWETTGDREAEAQYLAARLRTGDLGWSAIECAAYLGDEVCRGLLGEDLLGFLPPATGVSAFLHAFPFPDRQAYQRVAHAVFCSYASHVPRGRAEFEAGLGAFQALTECPCEAHAVAAGAAAAALKEIHPTIETQTSWTDPAGWMAHDLWASLRACAGGLAWGSRLVPRYTSRSVERDAALREEITRRLLPWVLVRTPPPAILAQSVVSWMPAPTAHADEQRERRLRAERDPEELDVGRAMEKVRAHDLLDRLEPTLAAREQLTNDQAARVVRAYLLAGGWKARGVQNVDSPSGRRRVRVQKKLLVLMESHQDGEWYPKASLAGRELPLNRAGELVLASMRAALGE